MTNPYEALFTVSATVFIVVWLIVAIATIIYAQYKHGMVSYAIRYYERRFHMFIQRLSDNL